MEDKIIFTRYVANTFLYKSFEEGLILTVFEINYLIFLLYADILYNDDYNLFEESFIKTKHGPILASILYNGNYNRKKEIISYYRDNDGKIMVLDEENNIFFARLSYIWNLYKYTYGSDLLKYLKENYCNVFSVDDLKKIDDDDILKDEINIREAQLNSVKKRCKSKV